MSAAHRAAAVRPTWRAALLGRASLITNAGSLFGTTVLGSVLGFAFWWLAARLLAPEAVGYGSAAVSLLTLLGAVTTLGLGTAVIAELAARPDRAGALVAGAVTAAAAAGALVGTAFCVLGPILLPSTAAFLAHPAVAASFVLGVALTAATLVLDSACVGLLRGGLQFWRNLAFALAKLGLLAAFAALVHGAGGDAILTAWVVGIGMSVLVVAGIARRTGPRLRLEVRWSVVRCLPRRAGAHNVLNLALEVPHLAMPVVATAAVSATAGAGFYAAWMIVSFLFVVPFHLGLVVYALGTGDERSLRDQARFTLRLCLAGGLAAVPVVWLAAPHVLGLFGPTYAAATPALRLLALAYFPMVVLAHYVAVARARGTVARAAWIICAGTTGQVLAAVAGAQLAGVTGLATGVLLAVWAEALLVVWPVIGVVRRSGTRSPGKSAEESHGEEARRAGVRSAT
ncbi:MAG: lipopolysaccharide biosynthesis protein [Pseudonocardia sp.]